MSSLLPVLLLSLSLAAPTAAPADSAPTRIETIAKQAKVARSQNRVQDAIRLYREGIHLRPSWTDGWWYLGSLLYDQDRFSEATIPFQHLLHSTVHRGPAPVPAGARIHKVRARGPVAALG